MDKFAELEKEFEQIVESQKKNVLTRQKEMITFLSKFSKSKDEEGKNDKRYDALQEKIYLEVEDIHSLKADVYQKDDV